MSRYIKHGIKKVIGWPDPSWAEFALEENVPKETWHIRARILKEAEDMLAHRATYESEAAYQASADPVVKQGHALKLETEKNFKDKWRNKTRERILIHIPDQKHSPAGYSLFTNFKEAFNFIGVSAEEIGWNDNTKEKLEKFKPTVILTSDHHTYLDRLDWDAIAEYKKKNGLKIGLTASITEYDEKHPLSPRLEWAKLHGIDFYYSYRDPEYVQSRPGYKPFFEAGYPMLYLPFGAHISHYFPVAGLSRDLNFAYIASKKSNSAPFLGPVLSKFTGFIDGPGWMHVKDFKFNRERDRFIYSRAKLGLNLHLPEQIEWACEVNERTYQLGACGVPQVVDNAKIIPKLFSSNSLFVAKDPEEYLKHIETILGNPEMATKKALEAQKDVFGRHTTYHRVDSFIDQLLKAFSGDYR